MKPANNIHNTLTASKHANVALLTEPSFKNAVSWKFHGESNETIREDLGYTGDLKDVQSVSESLSRQGFSFDDVYEWAHS